VAVGDLDPKTASFPIHVLDPFFCQPYSHLLSPPGQLAKSFRHLAGFFQALLVPPLYLGRVARRLKGPNSAKVIAIVASALVLSFVGLLLADSQVEGCWTLAIVAYLAFASLVSVFRTQTRHRLNLEGSPLADFILSCTLWPSVLLQLDDATGSMEMSFVKNSVDTGCIRTEEGEMPSNDKKGRFPENPMLGSLTSLSTPSASSIPMQSTSPNPSSHSLHRSAEELPKPESPECNNQAQRSSSEMSGSSSRSPRQSQDDGGGQEDEKSGEFVDNEVSTSATSPLPLPEVVLTCKQEKTRL